METPLLSFSIWAVDNGTFIANLSTALLTISPIRHWAVDVAIAWQGYGTKVTGYDMVDISKGLLPCAIKHGVKNNFKFIRGNLYIYIALLFYHYCSYHFFLIA